MSVLLQIKNLHKRYGAATILEEATASFSEEQKIGVIGRNGAGKSTLCKIIIGQEEQDEGTISRNTDLRLGYLEQHDPFQPEETVVEFLTRYTAQEEWRCGEMAGKFQLKNELLDTPIAALAGGYRTRVKLAAMLLGNPNFLVLDEPTNYLDLATLILLENFLQNFDGGFLIVSHDREFLKRTCNHTLEVENGRLTLYPGTIEEYFEFKEGQLEQKMAYNKTVEKKKEQLQEFVDRFRAKASTASRARSKMKQIERLKTIKIEHPMGRVRIRIPAVEKKTGIAFSCDNLAVGYPEKLVASHIRMEVDRGAHVAVLGDNGQGKTTFLKTIAGELSAKSGSFRWGTGLKIAYYAQHVSAALDPRDDTYTYLSRVSASEVGSQDILNLAGSFLFKGDEVKKKVAVLSGGERARLCLAGLLLTKSQVLLLDEPTNHLDFETVEALAHALKHFAGTVFFISHDRTFVNLMATQIIDVKNGRVSKYPGTYEDYVYHLETQAHELYEKEAEKTSSHEIKREVHTRHAESSPLKKESKQICEPLSQPAKDSHDITRLKDKISKAEGRIKHLTKEREDLIQEANRNPFHFSKQRNERIKGLALSIEKEEVLWLELQSQLESLKKK